MSNEPKALRREGDSLNRMEIRLDAAPDALSTVSIDSIRRLRVHKVPALDGGRYRVRSVLESAEKGVRESYWTAGHSAEMDIMSSLVQYRVRGVSDSGKSSKWVYSNLMTDEGEALLFQLLSDLADTMDWMDDESVEYMMNKFLEELYKNDWLDRGATAERRYEVEEAVKQGIQEIVSLFGEHTKTFRDIVRTEPEELALLFKMYGTSDVNPSNMKDELFAVFYGYLEDQIDWLYRDGQIDAFGEGGNPFAAVSDQFDLKVLAEKAQEAWNLFPEDHAHFHFRDLVSLARDPVVNERFAMGQSERTLNTFLFALSVMWALPEDHLSMDLANLVEDIAVIESETDHLIIEREGATEAILQDVIALVFEQTGQQTDLDVQLTAFWLMRMTEAGLRVHVSTERHERATAGVSERVRRKDTERSLFDELFATGVDESIGMKATTAIWNLERGVIGLLEHTFAEADIRPATNEKIASAPREHSQLLAWPRLRSEELIRQKIGESVAYGATKRRIALEDVSIELMERTINQWGERLIVRENERIGQVERKGIEYSIARSSTAKNRIVDRKAHESYEFLNRDRFEQVNQERQQYTFDEMDERFGLGRIDVGTTIL
ncbi:hypothetical protein ACQR3P_28565 [Rhodococcus sp. IEGM1300]